MQQERLVKIAFYAGVLLFVGWLYFSSSQGGPPAVQDRANRPTASDQSSPNKQQQAEVEAGRPENAARKEKPSSTNDSAKHAPPSRAKDSSKDDADTKSILIVHGARVTNEDGRVIYRGDVDLRPTIERIDRGRRLRFSHDGIEFENRERRLPKKPSGYYHEYIHPTPDDDGPGGQRVVTGREGEIFYTPDHYKSFRRVR